MKERRRSSRADKRRRDFNVDGRERRHETYPDLEIKTEVKKDNLLVWVENPLVATNYYQLRDLVLKRIDERTEEESFNRIIINMEKVPYADTVGLQQLYELHKSCGEKELGLILFRVIPRLKEIINILKLDRFMDIRDH